MKTDANVCFELVTTNENVTAGKKQVNVNIRIAMKLGWIEKVRIIVNAYDETEESYDLDYYDKDDVYAYFQTNLQLNLGMYYYHFCLEINGIQYEVRSKLENGNPIITQKKDLPVWKYEIGFHVPNWARAGTMYHIFIDRFRRGNKTVMHQMPRRTIHKNWDELPVVGPNDGGLWNVDFFGGNLDGITNSLNYIKGIGCNIIYISPPCYSQSNHRYDTSDYEQIDPYAGTYEILEELCSSAHKKGMQVILDSVFNHVGNDSKYFNEYNTFNTVGAYQSKESKYYRWFRKNEFGQFEYWWGMKNLPVCDGNCKEWKEYICGVGGIIDKWFKAGIDGLRLDVADELTDEFIEAIREAVLRNNPNALIIGEVWKNPMRMKRQYIKGAKGMDTVMNYPLADALIKYVKYADTATLHDVMYQIQWEYPETAVATLMNFTSTHDISRIINILGQDIFKRNGEWVWDLNDGFIKNQFHNLSGKEYKRAKKIFEVYFLMLAFFPGILSIFYGDEAGIQGIGNLLNRIPYPWKKRDKDLIKFIRTILRIRNGMEFLKTASFKICDITERTIYIERSNEEKTESVLIIASRIDQETVIKPIDTYKQATVLYSMRNCTKDKLAPYGAIILKNK